VVPPEVERAKASEGELGHIFVGIPWAEHAAAVTEANKESTNEGF
jgi:hypothetical protein